MEEQRDKREEREKEKASQTAEDRGETGILSQLGYNLPRVWFMVTEAHVTCT